MVVVAAVTGTIEAIATTVAAITIEIAIKAAAVVAVAGEVIAGAEAGAVKAVAAVGTVGAKARIGTPDGTNHRVVGIKISGSTVVVITKVVTANTRRTGTATMVAATIPRTGAVRTPERMGKQDHPHRAARHPRPTHPTVTRRTHHHHR